LTAFSIFHQVLEAVKAIHSRGIAHMDIKENNILIAHCQENESNPLTGYLPIKFKLGDFGISVDFHSHHQVSTNIYPKEFIITTYL
jgi:serine/threonine protein kinase